MKNSLVYGIHAVENLLKQAPFKIKTIWLLEQRQNKRLQSIEQLAAGVPVQNATRHQLDQLTQKATHQGVAAEIQFNNLFAEDGLWQLLETLKDKPALLLVLDSVQDPHNLGACLRTADAAGVDAVIIPKDKSVGITPAVRKVACGGAESTPVVQVTNLARTLRQLQEQGIWLTGATGEAMQLYTEVDYKGPIAIVMGSEGHGMRKLTKQHCDFLVKIPMQGIVSSLNVSVATGVMLFEVARQRQFHTS